MKKLFMGLTFILLAVFVAGCTKVEKGDYREGTYFGSDATSGFTATIYVDDDGLIKSVFIDAAYAVKDSAGVITSATTKQILGDNYGMKGHGSPVAKYEWYEQMSKLSNKVIDEQDINWLTLKYRVTDTGGNTTYTTTKPTDQTGDPAYTDAVSGVTIHVDGCYKALKMALDAAKK